MSDLVLAIIYQVGEKKKKKEREDVKNEQLLFSYRCHWGGGRIHASKMSLSLHSLDL